MKILTRSSVFCFFFTSLVIIVSSCGPSAELNKPRYVDPQGREIIPCTGDLCFDITKPEVLESLHEMVERFGGVSGDPLEEPWVKERMEEYAACNYYRGKSGVIQVDCPSWIEYPTTCPPRFFDYFSNNVVVSGTVPNRYYCVDELASVGTPCAGNLACEDGRVCTGALEATWDDVAKDDVLIGFGCLPAELCMKLADVEGVSVSGDTCFYSDFTVPKTGKPAQQECGSLAEGTCAVNCPCEPVTHPMFPHSTIDTCLFVSEKHPVGICARSTPCIDGVTCDLPGSVCAGVAIPAWVRDYASKLPSHDQPAPSELFRGYCVMKDVCDAWSAANPGVIVDGCDDASIPPPTP